MNTPQVPIAIEQPMPHRKIIREWLIPLADRNTALALVLLVADLSIWGALMVGTVVFESLALKLLCALVCGFWIGRLFIIGHDACHQSLTPTAP